MSDTYTKLFSSITESTVWGEPYSTRIAWVTMLAMADAHGCVYGSVPGLARRANITRDEVDQALMSFFTPDADSRTKDHDGRRIEAIDGGWRLINHAKYSAVRNAEERREYKREWDRKHRHATESDSHPTESDKSDNCGQNPIIPTGAATPTPTPTLEKEQTALPDWLPADAWKDWCDYKHARKGFTAKAKALSLRTLTECHAAKHDVRKVIETAIERGWAGLFAPTERNGRPAEPIRVRTPL